MKPLLLKLLTLAALLTSPFLVRAVTDLRLTSLVREGECTTLNWISHPGEFYTVYWTDSLVPPVFWRVAEVNVPSGGTNTTWSEGSCGEMMMSSTTSGSSATALTEKEFAERTEAAKARAAEGIKFLMGKLEEALNGGGNALLGSPAPGTNGGGGTNHTSDVVALRFYRVARTAVAGFVDGWGPGLVAAPEDLTNAFAISAGPRYAGAHSLAIRPDGRSLPGARMASGSAMCPPTSPMSSRWRRVECIAWR